MKYLSVFLILCLSLIAAAQPGAAVIDKIVAQVGDEIILKSDVEQQKLQAVHSGMQVDNKTDCQIIESLMFQQLLLNQAKLDSIQIADAQVDGEMENRIRVIENQIGGRDKMETFYGKTITQIKDEFRTAIREQLMAQEMERQITENVSVSPREIKQFFEKIPIDSIPLISSKLSFQQIVVYPEITEMDKKAAWEKLNGIRKEILGGKSFETMARIHSMDPGSAQQGGKIEASRGMMVPSFEATAFSLNELEVSQIFESEYGYHLMKLLSRKGDDYVCQHILISPEFNHKSLDESSKKMDECYRALKENTLTWDQAVSKYSTDENTKMNKGIITNPITGEQTWSMEDLSQVDQQIYLLTDKMNKGDLSSPTFYMDIFTHKQGIRIVRLMDRTQPHYANLEDDYNLIQKAAEAEKKQEVINKWVNAKIQNAYIRLDDEYQGCTFQAKWKNTP